MRVLFIARTSLFNQKGGDTIQMVNTANNLIRSGVEVDIHLTTDKIDYEQYDLLHFFNIIRPADILYHINKTKKPFVVSPILVDYSEFDKQYRHGLSGFILKCFSANTNEYIKTISRWMAGKGKLKSKSYLWKGQQKSIKEILQRTSLLLPNSEAEYGQLEKLFGTKKIYSVIPNGIDCTIFQSGQNEIKNNKLVICAARIEGIKNQLNLIRALNDTSYTLILIGSPAHNQKSYYNECKKIASRNILFRDEISQVKLAEYYRSAKVHALPSWFETCGLSSLEAAAMGCNITITDRGYTREYFGNDAFYCDPADPKSIFNAIENAAQSEFRNKLQEKIFCQYTWQRTAELTVKAYKKIIAA